MAGHSKWANIKHRKAGQDAKRGQVFTKLIRELTVAARENPKPEENPRLRLAVDKALSANMAKDTIDRAIARGAGKGDSDNLEELSYEGYGPSGLAFYIEAMTDNRNRTVGEVRHALTKAGGSLGSSGSVSYLFIHRGQIIVEKGSFSEEKLMELALEAGAEDIIEEEEYYLIITEPASFSQVNLSLSDAGVEIMDSEMGRFPTLPVPITDLDAAQKHHKLLQTLEGLDDVQAVFSNGEIDSSLLDQL